MADTALPALEVAVGARGLVKAVATLQRMWDQNVTRSVLCAIEAPRQGRFPLLLPPRSYTELALDEPISTRLQYIHIVGGKRIIKWLEHGLDHPM